MKLERGLVHLETKIGFLALVRLYETRWSFKILVKLNRLRFSFVYFFFDYYITNIKYTSLLLHYFYLIANTLQIF
jgi:hypothetical protein